LLRYAAHSAGGCWGGFCRRPLRSPRSFALRLSQQSFELGEDRLDRIEIGGVFRQEDEAGSDIPDRPAHLFSLVRAEIVEDNDVARLQRRREDLFDIGAETLAVDGSVEQAGRVDAVAAQGGEESRGLPLTLRDLVDETLSPWRPAAQAGHVVFVQSPPSGLTRGSRR
jgi:hypothetical protein